MIRDRLSFMRFLGLGISDRRPDAKTIGLYSEQLVRAGAMEKLFKRFDEALHNAGYLAMGGQIIDATVALPRQKFSDDEKTVIQFCGTSSGWSPAKRRQKDVDARWSEEDQKTVQRTVFPMNKRGRSKRSDANEMQAANVEIAIPLFGYKNHAGIDPAYGFIRS